MSTPTIIDPIDTGAIRSRLLGPAPEPLGDDEVLALADELDKLRTLLAGPCGSCHPCSNWSAQKLRERIKELVADYTYPEHWKAARERAAVPLDRVEGLLDD